MWEIKVNTQVLVSFSIGKYCDEVLCDVVPIHAAHLLLGRPCDVIQQVVSSNSSDPLQIPSGPITRARAKQIKEALNGLVQETWTKQVAIGSNLGKNAENVTNVIWAVNGDVDQVLGFETSKERAWT